MKKFKFQLQALLKLREKEEEKVKKELADSLLQLAEINKEIQKNQKEYTQLTVEYNSNKSTLEISHYFYYLQGLSKKIAHLEDDMMRMQNKVTQNQLALIESQKKVKPLHNLKEKEYKEWEKQMNVLENKMMDEVSVTRFLKETTGD
jgi:flagellar protein FliJ